MRIVAAALGRQGISHQRVVAIREPYDIVVGAVEVRFRPLPVAKVEVTEGPPVVCLGMAGIGRSRFEELREGLDRLREMFCMKRAYAVYEVDRRRAVSGEVCPEEICGAVICLVVILVLKRSLGKEVNDILFALGPLDPLQNRAQIPPGDMIGFGLQPALCLALYIDEGRVPGDLGRCWLWRRR